MDNVELLEKSTAEMLKVMKGVSTDKLGEVTPCSDFDVKGLLGHIFGGSVMLAEAAETGKSNPPDMSAPLPADLAKGYSDARDRLLAAFRGPGVLEKTLELPFGAMPGAMVAGIGFMEHLVHAWDLAKATGQSTKLDAELAQTCLEQIKPMGPMLRAPGVFGPELPAPTGSGPVEQLVAFCGRQV